MTWSAKHVGLSERGQVRASNEDRWIALPEQGIYLVADGMGGTSGGDLAAQLVAETLPQLIEQRLSQLPDAATIDESAEVVGSCIASLSRRLRSESQGAAGLEGMGSTVVVVVLRSPFAIIAHLGDSRAYRLHGDRLTRCTSDHTLLQLLFESGEVLENQLAEHPTRGQLTRFVGMPGEAVPDVQTLRLAPDDVLMLCSDGLTLMLGDTDIEEVFRRESNLEAACRNLVDMANEAGGNDNITVMLVGHSQQTSQRRESAIAADPARANSARGRHNTST